MSKEQVKPSTQQTPDESVISKGVDPEAVSAKIAYTLTAFAQVMTELKEKITRLHHRFEESSTDPLPDIFKS